MTFTAPGTTRTLAAFAADLDLSDVPPDVHEKVRWLWLDFFGAALGGTRIPEVQTLASVVLARASAPESSILGSGRGACLPDAAYCNGMAGDVLEHQDGYRFGGYHPSHALPALLAFAEQEDLVFRDVVGATVVAYEIANRIGRAMHPHATTRGWFPTVAAYGAAAGAGRLLGFDAESIASAIGATAYFTPAIMIESIFGGWTAKPAFAGQIARASVEGVLAARAGATGWPTVLEDRKGFIEMFSGHLATDPVASGLGAEWTLLEVHQKRFAGCRHTHAAAQAAIEVTRGHSLEVEEIADIDVEAYSVARALVDREVTARDSAVPCTLSLQYVTAAAVVHGEVTGRQYERAAIGDPAVQDLAARVRLHTAEDIEAMYPDFTATRVTVTTTDGSTYRGSVQLPAGDPRAPLTAEELVGKFTSYATPVVGSRAAAEAVALLLNKSDSTPIRAITAVLGGIPTLEDR